jgi:hypothetical protein
MFSIIRFFTIRKRIANAIVNSEKQVAFFVSMQQRYTQGSSGYHFFRIRINDQKEITTLLKTLI